MPRILHFHFKPKHNVGDAAVVLAVRELVESSVPRVKWTDLRMRVLREEPSAALLRRIARHDLIIIGGGGFCSRFALPLNDALIAAIDVPMVLFGIGQNRNLADPPLNESERRSLALLARKAALCSVRDQATAALLRELGVEAALTGDPALFLRPRRPWWPPRRRRPSIGLNLACHGWAGQDEMLERVADVYREVTRRLVAHHDPTLFYMVHTDRELQIARQLQREFPGLRICRSDAARLLWLYGQLDLVISMMLHSAIFAFAAGTPVIGIAYDDKSRAFFDDIGRPERCFSVATVTTEAVLAACVPILAGPPRREGTERRAAYRTATSRFVKAIAQLCHSSQ